MLKKIEIKKFNHEVEWLKNEKLHNEQHQKNQESQSSEFLVFGIAVNEQQGGYNDQQQKIDQTQSKH